MDHFHDQKVSGTVGSTSHYTVILYWYQDYGIYKHLSYYCGNNIVILYHVQHIRIMILRQDIELTCCQTGSSWRLLETTSELTPLKSHFTDDWESFSTSWNHQTRHSDHLGGLSYDPPKKRIFPSCSKTDWSCRLLPCIIVRNFETIGQMITK